MENSIIKLCDYGCGQEAVYQLRSGKWCCSKSCNSCPAMRKKNSIGQNNAAEQKSKTMKTVCSSLEKRKQMSEAAIKCHRDPDVKKRRSEAYARPEVKEKMSRNIKLALNRKETKEKLSNIRKVVFNNLELKKKISTTLKKTLSRPEIRQKFLDAWSKPGARERRSLIAKEVHNRPEVREKFTQAINDPEVKRRQSSSMKEAWKDPVKREKISTAIKEVHNKPEVRNRKSIAAKEVMSRQYMRDSKREMMLNGGAAYLHTFITNPSKPQVELFKILQCLCPNPVLNYPIYNGRKSYSIDVADPRLGLAFEYDGSYWHQDEKKEKERQLYLENQGWTFIRYKPRKKGYVPTLEEVKNDINKALGN